MEEQIVLIVVLILSVVIHEVAHGYMALRLGDPTAKLQGRLSLNPLVHIDPLMSVIVPGLLLMSGSPFLFGAAKPVPYNPYNLTDQRTGEAKVAAAGPASNLLIAAIFGLLIRFADVLALSDSFITLSYSIIVMNVFLAIFNMLPLPPLDGSKIIPIFLPYSLRMKYQDFRHKIEQNAGMALLIIFGLIFIGTNTKFFCSSDLTYPLCLVTVTISNVISSILIQPMYYTTITIARTLAGF